MEQIHLALREPAEHYIINSLEDEKNNYVFFDLNNDMIHRILHKESVHTCSYLEFAAGSISE